MTKFAEQITAYEAKRASVVGSMDAIMTKAAKDGSTLDAAQSEEYDGHSEDIVAIDKHLDRPAQAMSAMPRRAVLLSSPSSCAGAVLKATSPKARSPRTTA